MENWASITLLEKLFSFTNKTRRRLTKDFLWDEFDTINWFIEQHPVIIFRNTIFPMLIIIFLMFAFFSYFIFLKPILNWAINTQFVEIAKYFIYILFAIWLFVFIKSIKSIYNSYVDFRNDFIISFANWIYLSDKNWVFHHSQTKIPFDSIHTVKSIENHFLDTVLWSWTLHIKTTGDLKDIEFHFCKDIKKQVRKLKDLHSNYLMKNDIRAAMNNKRGQDNKK